MTENPSEQNVSGTKRDGKDDAVRYEPQHERTQNHGNDVRSVLIRVRKPVPYLFKVVHRPSAQGVFKRQRKRTDVYVKPEYGKLQHGQSDQQIDEGKIFPFEF